MLASPSSHANKCAEVAHVGIVVFTLSRYERLQRDGPLNDGKAEEFLVDFELKASDRDDAKRERRSAAAGPAAAADDDNDGDRARGGGHRAVDEDEWVEYKDAFGRDRRCLRRDLAAKLTVEEDALRQQHGAPPPPPLPAYGGGRPPPLPPPGCGGAASRRPELLSGDMERELERRQWEAEATAAAERGPVGPVHFQAVVPGEIRELGTGYYKFSTDEEQRAGQMSDLMALRDNTADQRRRRDALKKRRQEAQEERIAKIKKRKGITTTDKPVDDFADGAGEGETSGPPPPPLPPPPPPPPEPELSSVEELLAFYKTQAASASGVAGKSSAGDA